MQAILIKAIVELEVYALLEITQSVLKQGDIEQRNRWQYLLITITECITQGNYLYPFCYW